MLYIYVLEQYMIPRSPYQSRLEIHLLSIDYFLNFWRISYFQNYIFISYYWMDNNSGAINRYSVII